MKTWNEMNARERDAMVAERVMRWEWLERENHERGQYVWRKAIFPPEGEEWIRWNFNPTEWRKASAETPLFSDWDRCSGQRDDDRKLGSRRLMGLPHYSTEIQFAWLVVERMKPLLFRITGCSSGGYQAQFFDEFDYEGDVSLKGSDAPRGDAPTAPEAICLAACRAMGVEV